MKLLFKLLIILVIVGVVLTYLGYAIDFDFNFSLEKPNENNSEEIQPTEPFNESILVEEPDEPESLICEYTKDCPSGMSCIEGVCGTVADLYETDCLNKCSITGVVLTTSDGEEYDIKLGQGSYSMAGALTWKLLTTPEYCPGSSPLVPIRITSKSGGEIVAKKIITLRDGETSEPLSHALATEPTFTVTLTEVTEECS